ncbi:glutathione peroxidase [Simiduia agarivorans]|uniref:Glutathione peroxidase n=1 Tax=Simiduia agarivorans (strain DSM 21679 / JCM 13881 / BCRC 17597 / SA1) TaxID=1117647 RepID=K4L1W5_SIMAS|nr:glutathione peroxidase [Simiduia agarivorans]AFV00143.1 putative glutathione peroxidase [Simiduia agarivorans SA1 = DSM 21679]
MNKILCSLVALALAGLSVSASAACPDFLNQEYRKLHSTAVESVCRDEAKAYLLVNTASHCGFTPQFKGLEQLYQRFKDQGLVVVGFASDDFKQENKDEAKAADICYINYGVTFTMLAPTHVRGDQANPTFKVLGAASSEPAWNFNKYLVSADGTRIQHFGSFVEPADKKLVAAISDELSQ